VTPEAAVYAAQHRLMYRGRIDDRYVSLAVMRPRPTIRDLEQAVAATLAGARVPHQFTTPVGCFIAGQTHGGVPVSVSSARAAPLPNFSRRTQ
jgi:hypothetical protein